MKYCFYQSGIVEGQLNVAAVGRSKLVTCQGK